MNLSSSSGGSATSGTGSTGQQPRKRYSKRKRSSSVIRLRPWSFHGALNGTGTAEWIDEWDYYQPPSLIEYKSTWHFSLFSLSIISASSLSSILKLIFFQSNLLPYFSFFLFKKRNRFIFTSFSSYVIKKNN